MISRRMCGDCESSQYECDDEMSVMMKRAENDGEDISIVEGNV